jgi:hypothetical protein
MRKIIGYCGHCKKDTEQNAVVESYLGLDGITICINYWTRCKVCGENIINKNKEINAEDME